MIGALGLIVKTATTFRALRELRKPSDLDVENPGTTMVITGGTAAGPLIVTGLALLGGGTGQRGVYDAHYEMFDPDAHAPMFKKSRRKLGWGLFGGGMAVWLGTRLLSLACNNDQCGVATLEAGYYLSLPMTTAGIVMAGWGTGHDNTVKRFGSLANVRVAPMAGRRQLGLALAARF